MSLHPHALGKKNSSFIQQAKAGNNGQLTKMNGMSGLK